MTTRKVNAGQPFRPSARDWNEFVDTARALESGELNQSFDGELPEHSQTKVLIKNESGVLQPRFSILALGEPWKTPDEDLPQFKRQIVFRGVVPQKYELKSRLSRSSPNLARKPKSVGPLRSSSSSYWPDAVASWHASRMLGPRHWASVGRRSASSRLPPEALASARP